MEDALEGQRVRDWQERTITEHHALWGVILHKIQFNDRKSTQKYKDTGQRIK